MLAHRFAAAVTAAGTLGLAGCGAAPLLDRISAAASGADGTQAAVMHGWGAVVAGDEFNYCRAA